MCNSYKLIITRESGTWVDCINKSQYWKSGFINRIILYTKGYKKISSNNFGLHNPKWLLKHGFIMWSAL